MNPAILFVDDEPRVLDGLRDLLRRHRRRWDLEFCTGAEAAIAAVDQRPFAVVVTDMRMPRIDGATLLEHVREVRPSAIRIVLSGQMDGASALRAASVAHQFLSKPCDTELLTRTIEASLALQGSLPCPELRAILGRIDGLPAAPRHADLAARVADPGISSRAIAEAIEHDPAMVAKVLQLVNSAFFGLGHRISSVEHAVTYLGIQLVAQIVVAYEAQRAASDGASPALVAPLHRASFVAASVARAAAEPAERNDAFLAALLCYVGSLVVARHLPAECARIRAEAATRPLREVELEVLGITHGELGAYLLGLWGFEPATVLAVAQHQHAGPTSEGRLRTTWLGAWFADEALGFARREPAELGLDAATLAELRAVARAANAWTP